MRVLRVVSLLATVAIAVSCAPALTKDFPSGCGSRNVAIVVEPALIASIRTNLSRFEGDLCTDGYNTVEYSSKFTTPSALRKYLQKLYKQPGRKLVGAILIGDIPHAYQWVTSHSANPSIPDIKQEAISFQYYSDLDGTFKKSTSYTSPGGHAHSYDTHIGHVDWEIWVGVLPRYKGDVLQTAAAINRYFDKNHAFRTRRLLRPTAFLQINEHFHATTLAEHNYLLGRLSTGPYSWKPFSNSASARLYFDSPPGGLTVKQGYSDMQKGTADFTVVDAHGHSGKSGQLTISIVETNPVQTLFFWSNGCAIGNLDHSNNFLTSVLYSPTSDVLFAKGTTNSSAGMGTNSNGFYGHNIATSLAANESFGDAVRDHVNVPLITPWSASREFQFGTAVFVGDPTSRRTNDWREQESYSLNCKARPAVTVCVRYDDGFTWLVRDSIRSWEMSDGIQTAIGFGARYEHKIGTKSVRVNY